MARSHFKGPIRVQARGDTTEYSTGTGANFSGALGGLLVASNRNADPLTWIDPVNANLVDNASNIIINWSARTARVSNIVVGVSGTDTTVTAIRIYSATLGSGSIAANSVTQSSYTVTGLATGDKVFVIPPSSGISSNGAASLMGIGYAFASATDTLAIGWINPTAAANVHVTGTYTVVAIRS